MNLLGPFKKHSDSIFCLTYIMENGERYSGQIAGEKRAGYGICVYPDGRVYEGYWENDK